MKKLDKKLLHTIFILITLSIVSCKKEKSAFFNHTNQNKEEVQDVKSLNNSQDAPEINRQSIKTKLLLLEVDDKKNLSNIVETKSFFREQDNYILDYKYPFLDEDIQPSFKFFNDFIRNQYINKEISVKSTLNNQNLYCDFDKSNPKRYKRMIDYKIYSTKDNLLSVLLYKANHYKDQNHLSYMFKGLTFDINKGEFLSFDSIFKGKTQEIILSKLNIELSQKIKTEPYYQECWKLTDEIFDAYKDNFVIDNDQIKFYFDDCMICPTYAGRYSIKIPLNEISHFMSSKGKEMIL